MSDLYTKWAMRTIRPSVSPVERLLHPRDRELIAFGKLVDARLKVSLAFSETDSASVIARSAITPKMRAQSLATIVRTNGRAFGTDLRNGNGGEISHFNLAQNCQAATVMSSFRSKTISKTLSPLTELVERFEDTCESEFLGFGKLVVAQPKVSLAVSETDSVIVIARSAITSKMRKQSLTTIVSANGRATAQNLERVMGARATISTLHQTIQHQP